MKTYYQWERLLWCDAGLFSSIERGEKEAAPSEANEVTLQFCNPGAFRVHALSSQCASLTLLAVFIRVA